MYHIYFGGYAVFSMDMQFCSMDMQLFVADMHFSLCLQDKTISFWSHGTRSRSMKDGSKK